MNNELLKEEALKLFIEKAKSYNTEITNEKIKFFLDNLNELLNKKSHLETKEIAYLAGMLVKLSMHDITLTQNDISNSLTNIKVLLDLRDSDKNINKFKNKLNNENIPEDAQDVLLKQYISL